MRGGGDSAAMGAASGWRGGRVVGSARGSGIPPPGGYGPRVWPRPLLRPPPRCDCVCPAVRVSKSDWGCVRVGEGVGVECAEEVDGDGAVGERGAVGVEGVDGGGGDEVRMGLGDRPRPAMGLWPQAPCGDVEFHALDCGAGVWGQGVQALGDETLEAPGDWGPGAPTGSGLEGGPPCTVRRRMRRRGGKAGPTAPPSAT